MRIVRERVQSVGHGPEIRRGAALLAPTAAAALGLAIVGALCVKLGGALYLPVSWGTWFDADTVRVFDDISQPSSHLVRSPLHPFFGLLSHAVYGVLAALFRRDPHVTVQLELAATGAATLLAFHWTLRRLGSGALDALLFTGVLASSTAFVFFAPVPETFALGALTTVLSIGILARDGDGRSADRAGALACLLAFSATATNAAGPAAWILATRRKRSIGRVLAISLCGVIAFTVLQGRMFRDAPPWYRPFLHLVTSRHEPAAIEARLRQPLAPDLFPERGLGDYAAVLRAVFFHGAVMPAVLSLPRDRATYFYPSALPVLSVQHASVASGSPWGWLAIVGWSSLLVSGAIQTMRRGPRSRTLWLAPSAAGVQLLLHLFVGRETVLYSLHLQPLLVLVAASSCIGVERRRHHRGDRRARRHARAGTGRGHRLHLAGSVTGHEGAILEARGGGRHDRGAPAGGLGDRARGAGTGPRWRLAGSAAIRPGRADPEDLRSLGRRHRSTGERVPHRAAGSARVRARHDRLRDRDPRPSG